MAHIGIVGGGPAALFMYKRLVDSKQKDLQVTIFEKKNELGSGMPYSYEGACPEHITNVSDNEIPEIVESMKVWINTAPAALLGQFDIDPGSFNEYKVVPRLLFGQYLSGQFELLQQAAKSAGITTHILNNTSVTDIEDISLTKKVKVYTAHGSICEFDSVVICTGHSWPKTFEGTVSGWFDSPYPPSKFAQRTNYPVAIKGASLTAIDAVRTLARHNGYFQQNEDHSLSYTPHENSSDFRIVLHSLEGLLPGIRFHLEDSHLSPGSLLTPEEVHETMAANDGFIPLDYIFERNFKQPIQKGNPAFYEEIKDMKLEAFVAHMMSLRERLDAFVLFKAEYIEAAQSIKRRQSVYWKEMLATLSYAMNYPAKHLSAEDMLRLKRHLMPLISIVIAFVPQSSCRELMALHDAGVLSVVAVDRDSKVEVQSGGGATYIYKDDKGEQQQQFYQMFIDAVGQAPVLYKDFPFKSLKNTGTVSEAFLRFRNAEAAGKELQEGNNLVVQPTTGNYYLQVPGININDDFQVLDKFGAYNDRTYVMAVPFIAGLNPDYSGLDFCETASKRIVKAMFENADKGEDNISSFS